MTLLPNAGAWRGFWFPPAPPGRVALLRVGVGAYVALDLLLGRWRLRYGDVPAEFYDPIGLMQVLPRPTGLGLTALWAALLVGALGVTAGRLLRVSLPVTAAMYLYWYASWYSYGETSNSRTVIAVALVALALAGTVQACAGWVLQVLTVLLVHLYLFAGIAKLAVTGPDWWHSGALEWGIVDAGTHAGLWLLTYAPGIVPLLALGGLVFELCSPVLLVPGRARLAYAAGAVAFHLAGFALLDMDFLGMALVAVLVALPTRRRESGSPTGRVGELDRSGSTR